jgi:inner membrane protein
MDPLSQGVLGASAAQSASHRRNVGRAGLIGMLAGMAPDADVFIRSAEDPLLALEFHRQFTHALAFIPLGALLVALLLHPILARRAFGFGTTYLFCLVGYATHGLLDACTTYGTQLLWPFSTMRVAWNNVSVIDPLFTLPILLLVLVSYWRQSPTLARCALIWAVAYLLLGVVQRDRAVTLGHDIAAARGHDVVRLEAKPTFGNLVVWKIVYETEDKFFVDAVRMGIKSRHYEGTSIDKLNIARDFPWLHPASQQAKDIERFRWFSNHYLAIAKDHSIIDVRYSLVPNEIDALWRIALNPSAAFDEHVQYVTRRTVTDAKWQAFRRMLFGN